MLFLLWRFQTYTNWLVKELIKRVNLSLCFSFPRGWQQELFLSPGVAKRRTVGSCFVKGGSRCGFWLKSFSLSSEALISCFLQEWEGQPWAWGWRGSSREQGSNGEHQGGSSEHQGEQKRALGGSGEQGEQQGAERAAGLLPSCP